MKNFWKIFVLFLIFVASNEARLICVLEPKIESCTPKEEFKNIFDVSKFELVQVNDTDTLANGTWTFNKSIKSPWKVVVFLYRYNGGQWLLEFQKTLYDACPDLHNTLSPFYFISKYFPRCPIKPGSIATFDMISTQPPAWFMAPIPGSYAGTWKVSINHEINVDGEIFKECYQIYSDVYDVD